MRMKLNKLQNGGVGKISPTPVMILKQLPVDGRTMNDLVLAVLDWAHERNIINGSTYKSQYLKAQSEAGELAKALLEDDTEEIIDAIGDVLVCLINLSEQCLVQLKFHVHRYAPSTNIFELYSQLQVHLGILADHLLKADRDGTEETLEKITYCLGLIALRNRVSLRECLANAYNQIKDRKGIMFNEVFIKESDENYERIVKHLQRDI